MSDPAKRLLMYSRIVELRNRAPRPATWDQVARELGISRRHAQETYKVGREQGWTHGREVAADVLDHVIATHGVVLQELWKTYNAAPEGSSVRVRALGEITRSQQARIDALRDAGRLPRTFAAIDLFSAAEQLLNVVQRALSDPRADVPPEVIEDMLREAERYIPRDLLSGGETPADYEIDGEELDDSDGSVG